MEFDDNKVNEDKDEELAVTNEGNDAEQETTHEETVSEETGTEQTKDEPKKRRAPWLTPVLLGIIIGILLSILLVNTNLLNNGDASQTDGGKEDTTPAETTGESSHLSVDVTSQITEIVERVSPAVVGVTSIRQQVDFWRQEEDGEAGTGSGVIYKKDDDYAYIVTNHHVIEGADEVEVVLFDETTIDAKVLGSDLFTDLAVLRTSREEIETVADMGTSENLKVGEPAIAIGNPLGHMFSGTVTQGIISATHRTIPLDFNQDGRADWQAEVLQTDAAINPGNSGGALINMEGQLIGINSMKINESSVEGIGFAIPIDVARPVIEQLETDGKVTRAFLGVETYALEEVPKVEREKTLKLPEEIEGGVYIWTVEPLSPADKGGLDRFDVITELDGEAISDTIDLRKVLYEQKNAGDEIEITFYRDGEKKKTTVTLEEA